MTDDNKAKRRYLEGYIVADGQLERMRHQIVLLRAKGEQITSVITAMPHAPGGVGDRVGNAAAAIADRVAEYDAQAMEMLLIFDEVVEYINRAPSEVYRKLLTLRYIDGLSMRRISYLMCYSESHVKRLHGEALASLPMPPTKKEDA